MAPRAKANECHLHWPNLDRTQEMGTCRRHNFSFKLSVSVFCPLSSDLRWFMAVLGFLCLIMEWIARFFHHASYMNTCMYVSFWKYPHKIKNITEKHACHTLLQLCIHPDLLQNVNQHFCMTKHAAPWRLVVCRWRTHLKNRVRKKKRKAAVSN